MILGLCLLPWGQQPLRAQETEDFEVWDNLTDDLELLTDMEYQVEDLEEEELVARVGIIGGAAPEYRGSDEYQFSYAPNIYLVWKDRYFLKGRRLGVELFDNGSLYGGVFLRYNGGRSENNDGLEGLGDVSRTITGGAYLRYRYKGIRLKSEVRYDLLDEGHGTLAFFTLSSKIPWETPLFLLALRSTWTSDEHMDTFFGITPFQSLRSGLDRYEADAGFRDVSLSISSGYQFADHWSVNGQIRYQRLLGDAADSPIVRDVGSENNFIVGLALNYIF